MLFRCRLFSKQNSRDCFGRKRASPWTRFRCLLLVDVLDLNFPFVLFDQQQFVVVLRFCVPPGTCVLAELYLLCPRHLVGSRDLWFRGPVLLVDRGLRVPLRAVVSFASASTRFVINETFICAILLVWEVGSDGKFLTRLLFAGGIAGAVRDLGHLAHVPLERWALSSIPPLLESASVLGD